MAVSTDSSPSPVDRISSKLRGLILNTRQTKKERKKERKRGRKIRNAAVAAANEVKAATFRTSLGQNLARTRRAKRLKIERAEGGVT